MNRPTRISLRESRMLDSMFGSEDVTDEDFGLEIPDDIDLLYLPGGYPEKWLGIS